MRMKRLLFLKLCFTLAVCVAFAFSVLAHEGKDGSGKGRGHGGRHRHGDSDASYFLQRGYERLDIPRSYYPPPGQCRVWYPDRPVGLQPLPGSCGRLRGEVPPGAWLIHRPREDWKHAYVTVYDDFEPGIIVTIGVFEVDTGAFIRERR